MENSGTVHSSFEDGDTSTSSLLHIQSFREKLKSLSKMTGKLIRNSRKATPQSKGKRKQAGGEDGHPQGSSRVNQHNQHNSSRCENQAKLGKLKQAPLNKGSNGGKIEFTHAPCECFKGVNPRKPTDIVSSEIVANFQEIHLTQERQKQVIHRANLHQPINMSSSVTSMYSTNSSDGYSRKSAGSAAPVVSRKPMMQQMVRLKRRKYPCQCAYAFKAECAQFYQHKLECKCGPPTVGQTNVSNRKVSDETGRRYSCGEELESYASSPIESTNFPRCTCESETINWDITSISSTSDAIYDRIDWNPEEDSTSCHCCACLLNIKQKSVTTKNKNPRSRKFEKMQASKQAEKGYMEQDILNAVSSSAYAPAFDSSSGQTSNEQKDCVCPLCGSQHLARNSPKNNNEYLTSSICCLCQQQAELPKCTSHFTLRGSSNFTCIEKSRRMNQIPLMCQCPKSTSETTLIHSTKSLKISLATASNKTVSGDMSSACKTTQSSISSQNRTSDLGNASLKLSYQGSNRFSETEYICCKCKSEPALSSRSLKQNSSHDKLSTLCLCETPIYSLSRKSSRQSNRPEKRKSLMSSVDPRNGFEDNVNRKTSGALNKVTAPSMPPSMISVEQTTHSSIKSFKVHEENVHVQCKCESGLHYSYQSSVLTKSILEVKSAHSSLVSGNASNEHGMRSSNQKFPCICDICKREYSSSPEIQDEPHSAECLCASCLCPEESYNYISQHISNESEEDLECVKSNETQRKKDALSIKSDKKDAATLIVSENNKPGSESCTCIECCSCKLGVSENKTSTYSPNLNTVSKNSEPGSESCSCIECCSCKSGVPENETSKYSPNLNSFEEAKVSSTSKVEEKKQDPGLDTDKVNKEGTPISGQSSESIECNQVGTMSPEVRSGKIATSTICESAGFSVTMRISELGDVETQIQTEIKSKTSIKVTNVTEVERRQLKLEGDSKEKGFLAEDDSRCSCPKYNKELIELPDSCTCIQRPSDDSNVGSITSNPSNHSTKSKTCVCTQNLCASQGTSSELENKSIEGSGIQSFEQQSHNSELLKTVPDELNPDFASNLSGCSCQSSASSGVSIHSKSPSTISPSKSTTICSCSTTSPFTISSHKSIYSSKSQKRGSKNQSENESRREYESARGTGSEKLEKEEKTSEKRGEWDEDLVKEAINETSVISQGVDDEIKDPKEKDHRTSRDFTDSKCPNNCGCPDCPFLTTYSRPLKFKPLKMDAQEREKQRRNISIYGSDDLTYESNRLKTKKDSPVIRKDLQTSEKNLPINDFSSSERNFSMRNRDFQVQGNLNIQGNMTSPHGSNLLVQGRDVLVQGGGFPVQRKNFPIQQKDLPVSGNSGSVNEIAPRNFRNEPGVPLPRMNFSVSEKDLTCSKVLEQIRDVLCENKKETHDISNRCTCPCPRGGFYEPTHTCLPRCQCSCTPGKNSEYSGLTNFIANICEGKRSQNGMRSVTQIGDEYLNKAKDYECDDSLFGINNSMNSFFGFLFTEIKNIKNMLNCGLQKFGANEPADFDAKQVSRPAKCCPSGKGCIPKPTMNILPSCYPPPLCRCSPPIITIIGVQSVGSKSLLITWRNDQYYAIVGYEVYIDGCMKSRCFSPMRTSAVAFGVDLSVKHIITVIAIVDQGCSPCNCLPTKSSCFYQPNMLRLNDCYNICS